MTEPPKHPDSSTNDKNEWQPLWDWAKHSGFRGLLVFAGLVLSGVGLLAYNTPDPSQKMGILVVGILGIISFVVTVINAVSTARMTDIMERQETESTKQRELTGDILEEMKVQRATQSEGMKGQLEVMGNTLAEMTKARELEYTAMLSVTGSYLDDPKKHDGPQPICVTYRNIGRTPAQKVVIHIGQDGSTTKPADYSPSASYDATLTAVPIISNDKDNIVYYWFPDLSRTEAELLQLRKKFFYVWGRIEYEDIFGKSHWTEYCYHFVPPVNMLPTEHGNSSDFQSNFIVHAKAGALTLTGHEVDITVSGVVPKDEPTPYLDAEADNQPK